MPFSKKATALCLCFVTYASLLSAIVVGSAAGGYRDRWIRSIPPRPRNAMTGSQFAQYVAGMDEREREKAIVAELRKGNIPSFLRDFKPVDLEETIEDGSTHSAVVFVMPDYLAIGSDRDFLRIPMNLYTATEVARLFQCTLPTTKIVDAVYEQSYHLVPQPMTPGPRMRSTAYYQVHNQKIRQQRASRGLPLGALLSGHKKDLVLTNRLTLRPDRVAIYGWHQSAGLPIQPLSTVHGARYADYSHGVRLISETALVDGKPYPISDLLSDPSWAVLLSDEGPIQESVVLSSAGERPPS